MYEILERRSSEGQTSVTNESSGLVSETLLQQAPEIEYASPLAPPEWYAPATLSAGDKNIKAKHSLAGYWCPETVFCRQAQPASGFFSTIALLVI